MKIDNLPKKYKGIWNKAGKLLKAGRPDDYTHAAEVVKFILEYSKEHEIDLDIFIPTAMMHDIGHSALLAEDFRFVTGPQKIMNAKLVHMLAGAKIANDILTSVDYDKTKTKEIIDIIRVHDADQLKEIDLNKFYDTVNKKIFHDIDSLDRFTIKRLEILAPKYPNKEAIIKILDDTITTLFSTEFKEYAKNKLNTLIANGELNKLKWNSN